MTIPHYYQGKTRPVNLVRYEIPKSLDLDNLCPGRIETKRNLCHFVHHLRRRLTDGRTKQRKGFVAYSSIEAKKQYGAKGWQFLRRTLLTHEIVECNGSWSSGAVKDKMCQGYRLADRYLGDEWITVEFSAKRAPKALDLPPEESEKHEPTKRAPYLKHRLEVNLRRLEVDPSFRASGLVDAQSFNILQKISQEDVSYAVSPKCGRLTHRLSGLKKSCRHFLTVDGEQLASLDMDASYPTMMGMLLIQNYKVIGSNNPICGLLSELPLSVDAPKWLDLIARSDFYEFFCRKTGLSRERVKREISTLFCASLNDPAFTHNKLLDVLAEEFPQVYCLIVAIKVHGDKLLANLMMWCESRVFLSHICPALEREGYYWLPNHDCIFTTASQRDSVLAIMEQVVADLGITARFS